LGNTVLLGSLLAVLSGMMNGSFTLPMRFLGRWEWENVWSLFIIFSCLLLPALILLAAAPQSWAILAHAPGHATWIAVGTGFAWGFGAILFGQSVSAIGISLANTLVLAISSALGSFVPMVLMGQTLSSPAGKKIVAGVAVELVGIAFYGLAGRRREQKIGIAGERGDLVGHARPLGVALLLATGSGVLSAVFNIGFALAKPIAEYGRAAGLSEFSATNLIWWLMLGAGSIANLIFCGYLLLKNRSLAKFTQPGSARLYSLAAIMGVLWGGSIFVYGAAASRLGPLGPSIGWPLSLATGLLLANAIGIGLGEWQRVSRGTNNLMYTGIVVLLAAIVVLSRASY